MAQNPNRLQAELIRLAKELFAQDITAGALTCVEAAVAQNPLSIDARMTHADLLRRSLQRRRAFAAYSEITKDQKSATWAHMFCGLAYLRAGRPLRAADEYLQAQVTSPDLEEAYFQRGLAFKASRFLDLALKEFSHIRNTKSGFWLAELVGLRRDIAAHRHFARKSLAVARDRPLNPAEAFALLQAAVSIGRLRLAKKILQILPKEIPEHLQAQLILARRERGPPYALELLQSNPCDAFNSDRSLLELRLSLLTETGRFREAISLAAEFEKILGPDVLLRCCINAGQFEDVGLDLYAIVNSRCSAGPITTERAMWWLTLAVDEGRVRPLVAPITRSLKVPSKEDIPYVLVQYWNDPKPPPDVAACMRTWRANNPGLVHNVFSKETADALIVECFEPKVVDAFRRCRHPAMQSDVFRLAYLFLFGGIYVDADEICVLPIWGSYLGWKHFEAVILCSPDPPYYLMNGFMAARANSQLVWSALSEACDRILTFCSNSSSKPDIWDTTGPGLLTRVFARRSINGDISDGSVFGLMTFDKLRALSTEKSELEYKTQPDRNWRL